MRAVSLPGNAEVRVVERERPRLGPGEVLVRTRASAICRSDMSLYLGDNPVVGGAEGGPGTIAPGHEPAGEIAELGAGVEGWQVGDRIAAHLAVGCGGCAHCRAGYSMLCDRFRCVGVHLDGGDADYFVLPARNCLRLPDEVSFVAGAVMTDMIGSQYHVQKQLGANGGKSVAVFGLGPMGAAAVLVARALGARVIAVDLLPERLRLASSLGATATVNSGTDDAVSAIRDLVGGRGVDIAIDCSGAPPAQNAALDVAAKRGAVAFVGESRETTINPSDQIIRKLLTVVGGWYFPLGEWEEIARFVVDHDLPVEKLVTHRYRLDEAPEAFRAFNQRETEKAVFVWD